jgi:ABC-type amino acid transport substrate-binding protein
MDFGLLLKRSRAQSDIVAAGMTPPTNRAEQIEFFMIYITNGQKVIVRGSPIKTIATSTA